MTDTVTKRYLFEAPPAAEYIVGDTVYHGGDVIELDPDTIFDPRLKEVKEIDVPVDEKLDAPDETPDELVTPPPPAARAKTKGDS